MSSGGYNPGLPSLLIQAAQSAAHADGLNPPDMNASNSNNAVQNMQDFNAMQQARAAMQNQPPKLPDMAMHRKPMPQPNQGGGGGGKKKGHPLRRGKWTPEEEAYANRLIQEFKAGLLPLTDGTTLRTFLSKLLNCDPMRISKKFVGGNCIGKQVFRRRTADLNRLTPEQIQQSRAELSELERRFLERVAQTNRVKSSGVGGGGPQTQAPPQANPMMGIKKEDMMDGGGGNPPSPPWLQPPLGYKQGNGAAMAAANLAGGEANSRAAAAGRALLQGLNPGSSMRKGTSGGGMSSHGSAGLLAMAELQRRASQQSMMQNMNNPSAQNLLASLNASQSGSPGSAMAQMARNASAARMAGLGGGGGGQNSVNNLMLKTGFSRDQLSQLARERGLSSASLSNMIERQNSFDALMSLDFQSLQSIDNLANLIQTGGSSREVPESGMKNWSAGGGLSAGGGGGGQGQGFGGGQGQGFGGGQGQGFGGGQGQGSAGNLSSAARRLASSGRMESLLRSLSNNNVRNGSRGGGQEGGGERGGANANSNANLSNLLQSMSSMQGGMGGMGGNSMSSLLGAGGNAASAVSLANLLRENSSTGLTALRMQDGLNQRNSSVEDFLSLVAAGDIPHQDPALLNVPLMQHQQNGGGQGGNDAAANYLAQQQLLAQATGNPALANALASRSYGNLHNSSGNSGSAAALLARAAEQQGSSMSLKRRLLEMDGMEGHGSNKR